MSDRAFRTICKADKLGNDDVMPYYVRELKLRLSVARVEGRLYAFQGLCGHKQCPLSAGLLEGATIMCQCHGSKYDLGTGTVLRGPANEGLAVYEAREHQGEIQVKA
jgi:nitrite reductase/ring-hydroxylating ferredoxin subunit